MKITGKNSYFFCLLSCLFNALLLGMPAAYAQESAADKTPQIDKIFSLITPETPGCTVAVSQNGKVIVNRAYGLADLERKTPLSPNSIFDVASVQKQFTAAAILLLVEDGRLSLTDDIRKYLPELPDYGRKITIDNLITHTSGVRDWQPLLPLAAEDANVLKVILRQRGINFTPGDEWSYSSSGFELAKEIVARVSGMSFGEFARRRMFEPLGMKSSAYVPDILHGTGELALGYEKDGPVWKKSMYLGNQRAGGAVISTAGDLLIWNDALTNGRLGKFLSGKIEEPKTLNNGRKLNYARGLNVNLLPGARLVSHSGDGAGYSAWLGRFTDHNLSIAVLCNFNPVSATALAGRVSDVFLPPVDPNAQPPGPVAATGVDVTGRAGLYFDERTGEPMRLSAGGRLTIVGGPVLVPVSSDKFRPQRTNLFYRSQDDFEITFRSNDEFELKSMEGETTQFRRAQPWTPTAADVQAFDGRYKADELGQVLEVLPGTKGLIVRFERLPENTVETEPVARDTYMKSLVSVRFIRDASGKVTGFDYSNPLVRNIRFTRLGNRVPGSAASTPTAKESSPVTTPVPRLAGLVGEYEMAPGRTITITLENEQLYGEPTGSPKRPLVHVSGTTFAVGQADSPIKVTFTIDADGRATALVMRQNGSERTLPRVR